MNKPLLAVVAYSLVASMSAWGFPWNLPAVLIGSLAVGWAAADYFGRRA